MSLNRGILISAILAVVHLSPASGFFRDTFEYAEGTFIGGYSLPPDSPFKLVRNESLLRQVPPTTEIPATFLCFGEKFFQCSDCNTISVCVGNGRDPIDTVLCGGGKPYCNRRLEGDICSVTPEENEVCRGAAPPVFSHNFMCTSPGYFPNLANCNLYHICSRSSKAPFELQRSDYACPGGYYYVADRKLCRRGSSQARECLKREVRCSTAQTSTPVQYSPAKQFYYYCPPNRDDPLVFRCPDNSEYNSFEFECKYRCRKQGTFAYSDNPRRYFVCFTESRRLTSRIEECPEGHVFDPVKSLCVCDNDTKCLRPDADIPEP